jgi:hypothetical protein
MKEIVQKWGIKLDFQKKIFKEMLSRISIYDIYKGFEDSEVYQKLKQIGDELYPATQYANVFVVEKDPFASAVLQIISISYHLGVASFIQTEKALFLNEGSNLEYPYSITLRSMIELAGRVHKGIKLAKTLIKTRIRKLLLMDADD